MAFPPLGNFDHIAVSVSTNFPINSTQDTPFHRVAYDYSRADWDGLRDYFFVRTNRINILVIVAKGFLKLPNLHMILKQKNSSLPRSLALGTFGELLIVFSAKVNLYLLYSKDRRCCLLHLIKQNYLQRPFPRTLILMTLVSLYLFSFVELI